MPKKGVAPELIKHWRFIKEGHYEEESPWPLIGARLSDCCLETCFDQKNNTVNKKHGVDFLAKIIPDAIERAHSKDGARRAKILDSGGGLCFFADEIREKFRDEVIVYSTSLTGKRDRRKKKSLLRVCVKGQNHQRMEKLSKF